ncbi:GNAT family N-acetyltransferase [Paenibacillus mucilaginosus]|uniref:Acetyltransferase n=1 Tax=Paenibacillus mucilaginosus (strain KNP414) TaxID=1036673 RepID=F8FHN5_PAEMK|nr:GNAT family N-acetyltransferase [Paenibacillus mucilaginosus]AEI42742.1 acetyltransferase [Paenibacillus mucilaginosus KNP414]MCG7217016.1 GNAT family N-acetyltransferase [Paenibacillus mucilaginosus]WDM26118.1 GNAT family N-acetyltransferase [Paenibacillus mucilaginosus]
MRYTGEVWEPRRIICGLIAEEEGRAVGFGSMVIKNRFWQESYVGRITALVVEERMRGRGIGRTLIEELSGISGANGCRRGELDSGFHREGGHRFYEGPGFGRRGSILILSPKMYETKLAQEPVS